MHFIPLIGWFYFDSLMLLFLFYVPLFRDPYNFFGRFGHFEINWPLGQANLQLYSWVEIKFRRFHLIEDRFECKTDNLLKIGVSKGIVSISNPTQPILLKD